MLVKKLLVPFINEKILANAEHCYIATAALSEPALDFLMSKLPPKCKVDIVTGLDFPTSPELLFKVLKQYPTRIHLSLHTKSYFHPNTYIFDLPFRKMVAFVGSGSFTMGGIRDHEELAYKIDTEKGVEEVKSWFRSYFELAEALTERAILLYQEVYPSIREREAESKREKREVLEAMTGALRLGNSSLAGQYFQEEDYKTFENHKIALNTQLVQFERERVQTKLLALHEQLAPIMKPLKLQPHPHSDKVVSSLDPAFHYEQKVRGLWLTYGRGKEELDEYAQAVDTTSLKIILRRNGLGIWLAPGKPYHASKDLDRFRDEMQKDSYRMAFLELLKQLGDEYWIDIAGEKRAPSFFKSAEHLLECFVQESIDWYFTIGRTYVPQHPDVSSAKLILTIQAALGKLHPLYKVMVEK